MSCQNSGEKQTESRTKNQESRLMNIGKKQLFSPPGNTYYDRN